MNKIDTSKVTEGVAVHCKTEDEAKQLFDAMGWEFEIWYLPWCPRYVWKDTGTSNGFSFDRRDARQRKIVEFTDLIIKRSKLAEILGVEDGELFVFRKWEYHVSERGLFVKRHGENIRINSCGSFELAEIINHAEEIERLPEWGQQTVEYAKAAIRLFGFESAVRSPNGTLRLESNDKSHTVADNSIFPELKPGESAMLADIISDRQ